MIEPDVLFGRLGNRLFQMAYIYNQMLKDKIPDIYVQSEEFFEENRDAIKQLYGYDIGKIDKVAIHVRRGDYINNPFYVDLTKIDYYQKAMEQFPGATFIVFSDDVDWCIKNGLFVGCGYSNNDEITDLNKMASCTGHIIANSSYSWWGAYLSPNCGKVVAPSVENWYADGIERTKCPKEWIRI